MVRKQRRNLQRKNTSLVRKENESMLIQFLTPDASGESGLSKDPLNGRICACRRE